MKKGIVLESLTNRQDFIQSILSLEDAEDYYILRESLSQQFMVVNLPILTLDRLFIFDGNVVCFSLQHLAKCVNSSTVKKIAFYFDNLDIVNNKDYIYYHNLIKDSRVHLFAASKTYQSILSNYTNKESIVVEKYNLPQIFAAMEIT